MSPLDHTPDGWTVRTVSEAFDFTRKPRGLDIGSSAHVPFVPMDLIPFGGAYFGDHILKSADELSSGTYFERGDLLLPKITPSFENGKQGIARDIPAAFGYATTEVIPIHGKAGESLTEYLGFYLLQGRIRTALAGGMEGSTGRQRLPRELVGKLEIAMPPIAEQHSIAAVLGKIQVAVAAQQAIIDRTAELKAALMAKLFTEGTRGEPLKDERFGRLPTSWRIEPLESCASVQTGVAKGRNLDGSDVVELPYLRVANVQDGRLDLEVIKSIRLRKSEIPRYRLETGDVVLTEGGDFDKLGRGFIWHGQIDPCVHQNHVFAVRVDRSRLIPEFFAYVCQSPFGKGYFLNVAHRTTNLACINTAKLKALPVPIPTVEEQQRIVESLDSVQSSMSMAIRRRELYRELFATMLDELMTGRIRLDKLDLAGSGAMCNG